MYTVSQMLHFHNKFAKVATFGYDVYTAVFTHMLISFY